MKHGESWISGSEEVSFFSLKSRVNQVLSGLGLDKMSVSYKESDHADYAYGLELAINNKKVGVLGAVSKNRAKQAGLKKPVFMAELSWDRLLD
jgi:phenylalanyl-tRNA synthetase beta subunit